MAGEANVNPTAILGMGLGVVGLVVLMLTTYFCYCRHQPSYPELEQWSQAVKKKQSKETLKKLQKIANENAYEEPDSAGEAAGNTSDPNPYMSSPAGRAISNVPQPGYLNLSKGIAPATGRESTDMIPFSMTQNFSTGQPLSGEDKFPDSNSMNLSNNAPQPATGRESTDMIPFSMTQNFSTGQPMPSQEQDKFPDSTSMNYSKPRAPAPAAEADRFPDSVNYSGKPADPSAAGLEMDAFPDSVNLSTGAPPPRPGPGRESTDMVPFSVTVNYSNGAPEEDVFPLDIEKDDDDDKHIQDIL